MTEQPHGRRVRASPPALLAALVVLAGCVGPGFEATGAEYSFEGTFTVLAVAADVGELRDRVLAEGGEFFSDDKLPPSFVAGGLTGQACRVVHEYTFTRIYIDVERLGTCAPTEPAPADAVDLPPEDEPPALASMPADGA